VAGPTLKEISGLESFRGPAGPRFVVHNDDGPPDLFVLQSDGSLLAQLRVEGADHRDWEDITWIPEGQRQLLAVGDIGDNLGRRDAIRVYFIEWPESLLASAQGSASPLPVPLFHALDLIYPDGARDCESMSYDPHSDKLLFLTKRDKPPRLYGVDARAALNAQSLELEFLGTTTTFRPPTHEDVASLGKHANWISQPTGWDINDEGTIAAVITYRSLYLFERAPDEDWATALQRSPREFLGPASWAEEAIAFDPGHKALYISTEGHPAPIYHTALPPPRQ
jgi:hypothetical protein